MPRLRRCRPLARLLPTLTGAVLVATLSGCPQTEPPKQPNPTPPKAEAVKEVRKADDAAAIKALEEIGVTLTKDAAGSVVAVNCGTSTREVKDEDLPHLKGFPYLATLSLEKSEVSDKGLEILKDLPPITRLGLRRCSKMTDAALANLQYTPKLRVLELLYTFTSDAGLDEVAKLKELQALDLRGCNYITDAGLAKLENHTGLKDIKLRSYGITDAGIKSLTTLKNLRILEVEDAQLGDSAMEFVAQMPELTKLNLMRTLVSSDGFKQLKGLTKLTDLRVRGTNVTGEGLAAVEGSAPTLAYLDISECPFVDADMAVLAKFTNLTTLKMFQVQNVSDESFKNLAGLKKLKMLDVSKCPIGPVGADAIASLPALEELSLAESDIDDAGLAKIAGMKTLKKINLKTLNKATEAGLAKFKAAQPNVTVASGDAANE